METETAKPETKQDVVPPYFAFKTLLNTLEDMKKRGIPNRIDRTFLTGMSGAGQTQFLHGLRSLGLLDGGGVPSNEFKEMVNGSSKDRQRVLGDVLRRRYPEAVELGKTNATTGELVEVFRGYGAHGDTARKGIAFYLNAAKFAGDIPLSPLFQTPKISTGTGSKKRRKATGTNGAERQEEGNQGGGGTAPPLALSTFSPIVAGVLAEFPAPSKGWTKQRRDEVMRMFEMAVDFTIPIRDDAAEGSNEPEGAEELQEEETEEEAEDDALTA